MVLRNLHQPIINTACVSMFPHLTNIYDLLISVCVNFSISPLTLLCYTTGPQLIPICASNGDTGGYTVLSRHLVQYLRRSCLFIIDVENKDSKLICAQ